MAGPYRLERPPSRKSKATPKTSKKIRRADEIAEMASRGEDISVYFSHKFTVVRRVNVDLTGHASRSG